MYQVGACIVSPNKTVVGVGYNSMPKNAKINEYKHLIDKGRGHETFEKSHYDTERKFLYGKKKCT